MAIITITRGIRSGGQKLAYHLSDILGYKCLGREVIAACAKKYNIIEDDLYNTLIEAPRFWKKMSHKHYRYLIYIQCSLIDTAKQDNIIYHGYAGHLFLRGVRHTLKIRLEAPLGERIRMEIKESGKTHDEALAFIQKSDEERNDWVKFLYGREWHDPSLFDLTINSNNISIPVIGEIVALLVKSDGLKTTKQSLQKLHDLSLECEVKAAITADDKIWDQPVTVTAHGSVIDLYGTVKNKRIKQAIIDVASMVKGVTVCNVHLNLTSDPIAKKQYGY